jgi:hypothetical protein
MVIRLIVALAIIVPLMLTFRNQPWYITFLIAFGGFGAGHLVEYAVRRGQAKKGPPP